MNPLYNMIMSGMMGSNNPQSMNPFQKAQYLMQAMTNPAVFVKNAFPDIPYQIQNDPGQILQYLQQTRNISNEQLHQTVQNYGNLYKP